ncbi:MAG: tryptophan 7-halogenase [Acidobacteria bacterium]|nr:tryptophan 7-halogenase [Acidobacteriota bacterium]
MNDPRHYDVILIGAGLAGLSLARHLLLDTEKTVLLLERREEIPLPRQKVGESQVQLAGHYFSRVLDLEEYLFLHHFMKYNLRFYFPSGEKENSRFEELGKSYIRPFSNIPSYQVDRNELERELLRRNLENPRFSFRTNARITDVELSEAGPHRVSFEARRGTGDDGEVTGTWVVDTTGRGKLLARRLDLHRTNEIHHGSFFWWVDGLVDIDRLTDLSRNGIRKKRERRHTGHSPSWLATNHFMGEGFWFWVIPLQGKTSLGLVYDHQLIPHEDVFSVEKATKWICERYPLFARDLPHRKVLDFGGLKDYSFDCAQTISPQRWAMAGEAGRFTDPLYSPGSDLISIYNTLIVEAIRTEDEDELAAKCRTYEQLMRAVYAAYLPTYAVSYDALGDQEAFSLKYTWELTVYFAFYVFPFINDFFTDRRFALAFMRCFGKLGPMNAGIQALLSGFYQWKKQHRLPPAEPLYFDFMELAPLARAEKTFYEVGVSVDQAKAILQRQLANLEEFARFLTTHVAAVVLDEPALLTHRAFVEGLDLHRIGFDPEGWEELWQACRNVPGDPFSWSFDVHVMDRFRTKATPTAEPAVPEPMPLGATG